MARNKTYNRRNLLVIVIVVLIAAASLTFRLGFLMILKSEDYAARAQELHERERRIKAKRIEVTKNPVCFRATVRVLVAIVIVIAIRALSSTVGVRLDGLEQV